MQDQQQGQQQSAPENTNLVAMWEQMGASTGSFLGKTIGLWAQYGLDAYQQMVVKPLQQYGAADTSPPSETGVPADIREQTWREMGKEYGETMGASVGMAMDMIIKSMKNTAEATIPGFDRPVGPESPENKNS